MTTTASSSQPRFEATRTPAGLHLEMAACLTNIDAADAQVSALLQDRDAPVDRFAVRILLREAALNAVTHGSGQDAAKQVRIDVTLGAAEVELRVEDDGPGFAWQERPPTFDVMGDGGRGLALMHMYASAVEFNERGNCVVLRRQHEPHDARAQ